MKNRGGTDTTEETEENRKMSRRSDGQLFVGRLNKSTRVRDLEELFEPYGRMIRCDIKYGAEMAYAFIDFEDKRDAEDCVKYENGRQVNGQAIIVEWAKGNPRQPLVRGYDECYKCHSVGHWARDCPDERYGGYGGRGGGGSYGGRSNRRYRSPSPRSRRRRSRSRSRDRRRSRSQSSDRKRRSRDRDSRRRSNRSRSASEDRHRKSKSRSASPKRKSKSRSISKSKSRSPSRSPAQNGDGYNQRSRSHSRSRSPKPRRSRSSSPKPDQF